MNRQYLDKTYEQKSSLQKERWQAKRLLGGLKDETLHATDESENGLTDLTLKEIKEQKDVIMKKVSFLFLSLFHFLLSIYKRNSQTESIDRKIEKFELRENALGYDRFVFLFLLL
jgi:hypothetical protein